MLARALEEQHAEKRNLASPNTGTDEVRVISQNQANLPAAADHRGRADD